MKNFFKKLYIWQNIYFKNKYLLKKKAILLLEKMLKLKNILKKILKVFTLMLDVITQLRLTILYFCTREVGQV